MSLFTFLFWFKSSQVKCIGSSLHGDNFTTSYSPTTWPRLLTTTTLHSTTWIWFFIVMSTYTLSYTMLLMTIIILRCIYYHYDTCNFNSVSTTYLIGSNINIIQWYNNNDHNLSTSWLMFLLLLVSSNIDCNDPWDDLSPWCPSLCAQSNLLIQH